MQIGSSKLDKIFLQTNLKWNPSNPPIYIFLLNMNFENLTVGLHVIIIFSMLTNF